MAEFRQRMKMIIKTIGLVNNQCSHTENIWILIDNF